MNTNNVVSLNAATGSTLAGKEGARVKMTATGIDLADAADTAIGTLVRGPLPGTTNGACAVHLFATGLHYGIIGNATAVSIGDLLAPANGGQLIKSTTGSVAMAIEGAPSSSSGGQIRVLPL
jgi:hypothetical protein